MQGKAWTFARWVIPVEFKLIAFGVSIGVLVGLVGLRTETLEVATAMGLAASVSLCLGCWLGINLWLLTLRAFKLWSVSLKKRLEALDPKLAPIAEDTPARARNVNLSIIEIIFFGLVPAGFSMASIGAIFAIIDLQVDIYGTMAYVPSLCVGLGYALLGLAGQSFYLWRDSRRVARLERRLKSAEVTAPVILQTPRLERAISKASSIVCKLTGVGCPASDETATA